MRGVQRWVIEALYNRGSDRATGSTPRPQAQRPRCANALRESTLPTLLPMPVAGALLSGWHLSFSPHLECHLGYQVIAGAQWENLTRPSRKQIVSSVQGCTLEVDRKHKPARKKSKENASASTRRDSSCIPTESVWAEHIACLQEFDLKISKKRKKQWGS